MAVGTSDVARVDIKGLWNGVTAVQNVWYLRNDGTSVDEADAIDDFVEVLEAIYQLLNNVLNILWVIQQVRAINITDSSDIGTGFFVDVTPGTLTGAQVAPQTAAGLILDTQRLASKGRKFFGPLQPSNFGNSGLLTAGTVTALANVGDECIIPQVATNSTWRLGIMSTLVGVGFLPFVGYGVSPSAVTQRRRRVGVGI